MAQQLVSEAAELEEETDAQYSESVQILQNATIILSTAQQLSNNTRQVTLQQLQGQPIFTRVNTLDVWHILYVK